MKGPIGYELSPLAEEFSELIREAFHPCDLRAARLLQIVELMDVEIASRGKYIQTMNTILGYDNSDGMHSTPSPHDLAKRALKEARAQFEVKSNELTGGSGPEEPTQARGDVVEQVQEQAPNPLGEVIRSGDCGEHQPDSDEKA